MKEELKGRIQVTFDNKPVGDVRLVVLRIWNSGNLSIKPEDYKEPISVDFGMLAEILDVRSLSESVKPNFTLNGGNLVLDPTSLSSKETITMKVLLTRFNEEINVFARVGGASPIKNWDKTLYAVLCNKGIIYWMLLLVVFLLSFFVFFGSTYLALDMSGILYNTVDVLGYQQPLLALDLAGITALSGIVMWIASILIPLFRPEILSRNV